MAKRFAGIFFITLGVAIACVATFVVVLFLAPGFSVFGLKYIAKGTHVVNETCMIAEKMEGGSFSGSIRVEVEDVPVQVVFSQGFSYQVEYYDNFNGLTNSKFDDPSIAFSKDADGTAVIKITSFKKFIYENGNSNRFVKILIPSSGVGATNAGKTDLKIVSKTSPVSFSDEINDYYDPLFNKIEIETYGKVTSSTRVYANTYSLKTINAINIHESETEVINATNYILDSTGGKIVVSRPVSGDITATTKNARIQVLSCRNLTASSGYGDIYSSSSDAGIVVNGAAKITTTAGVVDIDSILGGSEKSVITTKTGNVTIKKAMDVDLTTSRGFVKLNSVRKASITTTSGSITVNEVTEKINAVSKRGKINLGAEASVLYNPTVESTYGGVNIYSSSGTVKVTTIDADVNFTNTDSSNIQLNVGGNLTANKLTGSVDVEVSGNASVDFVSFTHKSNIVGKGDNSSITVQLLNNNNSSFSYSLQGNDASLFEYNTEDVQNHVQIGKAQHLVSAADMVGKPLLSVSSKGRVMVYYKRSV